MLAEARQNSQVMVVILASQEKDLSSLRVMENPNSRVQRKKLIKGRNDNLASYLTSKSTSCNRKKKPTK